MGTENSLVEKRKYLADLVRAKEDEGGKEIEVGNIKSHVDTLITYLKQKGVDTSSFEVLLSESPTPLSLDETIRLLKALLVEFDDAYSKTPEYGNHLAIKVESIAQDARKDNKAKVIELVRAFFELESPKFEGLTDLEQKLRKLKKKFARNFHPDQVENDKQELYHGILSRLNDALDFVLTNLKLLDEADVSSLAQKEVKETLTRLVLTQLKAGDRFKVTTASNSEYVIEVVGYDSDWQLPVGRVINRSTLYQQTGVVFSSGGNSKVLSLGDKLYIGRQAHTSSVKAIELIPGINHVSSFDELKEFIRRQDKIRSRRGRVYSEKEKISFVDTVDYIRWSALSGIWLGKLSSLPRSNGIREKAKELFRTSFNAEASNRQLNEVLSLIKNGVIPPNKAMDFFGFLEQVGVVELTARVLLVSDGTVKDSRYEVASFIYGSNHQLRFHVFLSSLGDDGLIHR